MISRFRYLPCALHPALAHPFWAKVLVMPSGPNGLTAPFVKLWADHQPHVDLTFAAGWDHAVRAFFTIRGITVDASESATFYAHRLIGDDGVIGIRVGGYKAGNDTDVDLIERVAEECRSPGGAELRREALCRCICAALGVDVDQVFPLEKA